VIPLDSRPNWLVGEDFSEKELDLPEPARDQAYPGDYRATRSIT